MIDYLIVGQGIAGTFLSHKLIETKRNFLVIDNFAQSTSSKVAAGMFNPISGKRMVKSWHADLMLEDLKITLLNIEYLLKKKLLFQTNIYQLFGSVKEQNDLTGKMDVNEFSKFIHLYPQKMTHLVDDFGAFETLNTGWVNTLELINGFREHLKNEELIINEQFDYNLLSKNGNHWHYKNLVIKNIIFCEGYKSIYNPFFSFLPFVLCKGEVFTIRCKELNQEKIIKKGIYLVPLGNHLFKVGATYEWNDLSEEVSEQGKNFLIDKLNQILTCNYEIISHEANVRPTTKDRKAILGEHFEFSNMYIFNGLGTKGILQAPYLSHQIYEYIANKKEIEPEVSINRFQKLFIQ